MGKVCRNQDGSHGCCTVPVHSGKHNIGFFHSCKDEAECSHPWHQTGSALRLPVPAVFFPDSYTGGTHPWDPAQLNPPFPHSSHDILHNPGSLPLPYRLIHKVFRRKSLPKILLGAYANSSFFYFFVDKQGYGSLRDAQKSCIPMISR